MNDEIASWEGVQRFIRHVNARSTPHPADSREVVRHLASMVAERDDSRHMLAIAVKDYAEEKAARIKAETDKFTLLTALVRLRDCDWTIGIGDRMDPVRQIAGDAINDVSVGGRE